MNPEDYDRQRATRGIASDVGRIAIALEEIAESLRKPKRREPKVEFRSVKPSPGGTEL